VQDVRRLDEVYGRKSAHPGFLFPAVADLCPGRRRARDRGKRISGRADLFKEPQEGKEAWTVNRLASWIDVDPAALHEKDKDGVLRRRSLDKIPLALRRCISKIRYGKDGEIVGIELVDKAAAAATLLRSLRGAAEVAVNVDIKSELSTRLDAAMKRVKEAPASKIIDVTPSPAPVMPIKRGRIQEF
jgi:hypothetical protein